MRGSIVTHESAVKHALSIKTRQWIGIAVVAVAATSLLAIMAVASGTHSAPEASDSASGSVALTADQYDSLTTATAEVRDFHDAVTADGRIAVDGDKTAQVYSPYTGLVQTVLVEPGQHVTRGQPLFTIQANEAAQGASDLSAAQTALDTAKAQESVAEGAYRRAQIAYQSAGGAQKDVEGAERDLITAKSAVTAAQSALTAERNKLAIMGQASGGAIANANGVATVRAPIDGVIAARNVAPGQRIVDITQSAVEVTDTHSVWLEAQVSEEDSGKVSVGQMVDAHVDAFPGRTFKAKVLSIAPVLDPDTHRLPVHARIDNADQALKPDMFASIDLYNDAGISGLAVPTEAVVREGDDARVWVMGADRRASMRRVMVGVSASGYTQILSGLQPGERVVVSGALFVDKAGLG